MRTTTVDRHPSRRSRRGASRLRYAERDPAVARRWTVSAAAAATAAEPVTSAFEVVAAACRAEQVHDQHRRACTTTREPFAANVAFVR